MTTGLDDLFVQIIQSEGKAKEEKKLLNGVKSDIACYKQKIIDAGNKKEAMRGKLVQKVQSNTTAELEENWASSRAEILKTQVKSLQNELDECKTQLKCLTCQMDDEREEFLAHIREFNKRYDLISYTSNQRDSLARKEISTLKHRLDKLKEEQKAYVGFKEGMLGLSTQKDALEMDLKRGNGDENILREIDGGQETLKQLLAEKEKVSAVPQTDPEFRRLQDDLENCRTLNLESKYNSMQQELKDLQRRCWQKSFQQQQKHKQQQKYHCQEFRQQQQQQQQKLVQEQPDSQMKTLEKMRKFNFQRFTNYEGSQEEDDLSQLVDVFSEEMNEGTDIPTAKISPVRSRKRPNIGRITKAVSGKGD